MTHLSLLVLLGLVGHYIDLLAFAVLHNIGRNLCTFQYGITNFEAVVAGNRENAIKLNLRTCFNIKFLNEDDISLVNLVLLYASLDYCKHEKHLSFIYDSLTWAARSFFIPPLCGRI